MSRWRRVCGEDELASGQMRGVRLGDADVLLARVGDRVFATGLTCTHAEADLSSGFLGAGGITCPLHLSVFDLETGKPRNPPAEEPLPTFNVKIEDGAIYVEV